MKRADVEHILRAASAMTMHEEFILIGSQSVLGSRPDVSTELDTESRTLVEGRLARLLGAVGPR